MDSGQSQPSARVRRQLPQAAAHGENGALGPEGGQGECDIEDFNTGLVHFENGATMSLESNWLMHPGGRSSGGEFLGDLGVASLRPLRIELEEGGDIVDVTAALPADESVADRCGNIIHDLCQSVLEDRLPLVRFEQMLDVQRLMNGLYDAAEQGREVEIAL